MLEPLRAERDETARQLHAVQTGPGLLDPLALSELALRTAVLDHAIDLFTRLPFQVAAGHVQHCSAEPCHQFRGYGFAGAQVRDIVATTLTRSLELLPDPVDPPAPVLRLRGGQSWTQAMTQAWLTPGAPARPNDLPSGVAVPRRRASELADGAIAAFLEHRDERGDGEQEARQRAADEVLAAEANRERHHNRTLATGDGTRWTDMMSRALFDLRALDRPTDLPWSVAVPPQRARALVEDAIGLFLEFRDHHGQPEEHARQDAVAEVLEGEDAREQLEWPGAADTRSPAPQDNQVASPGVWCSYLEYAEPGTTLGYGHVVAHDGDHVQIRPEGAATDAPLIGKHRLAVDFQPHRREGESIQQAQGRLHGRDHTSAPAMDHDPRVADHPNEPVYVAGTRGTVSDRLYVTASDDERTADYPDLC